MKKIVFTAPILCLIMLALCITGCKRKINTTENKIVFDSISVAETYYLFSDSQKPSCNLQIHFVYPKTYQDEKIRTKIQSLFIEKVFGENFSTLPPNEAAQKYKDLYIVEFKQFENKFGLKDEEHEEHNDSVLESEDSDETGNSFYASLRNSISFNKNDLVSMLVEYNNYQGGAHGSHSIYGYIIDLSTGTVVSEDQVFADNYKKALANIIVNKNMKSNGVENPRDLENMGYSSIDDMVPNGNFIVNDTGITYFFNENEIAAYVMGITKVFIPYNEVSIYMKKNSLVSKLAEL